jgi:hypothetical protein
VPHIGLWSATSTRDDGTHPPIKCRPTHTTDIPLTANTLTHDDLNTFTHDDLNTFTHDDLNTFTHDDLNTFTHDDLNTFKHGQIW